MSCAFGPEGQFLVTRRKNKHLCVYDVAAGRELWQPPTTAEILLGFASPDGKLCFGLPTTQNGPKNYRVWTLPDGRDVASLEPVGVTNVGPPVFSADDQWLAMNYLSMDFDVAMQPAKAAHARPAEYGIALWNLSSARKHLDLHGPQAPTNYAISSDNRLLAIGYRDGVIHLWDLIHPQKLLGWRASAQQLTGLQFGPDSTVLAAADGQTSAIQMLDLARLQSQLKEIGLGW